MSKNKTTTPKKKSSQTKILKGRLDISRSGMGFVIVEGAETDIIVKPNNFGKAFHGDTVRVQVEKESGTGKRTEGIVVDVIERKQTEFIGAVEVNKNVSFFIPASEKVFRIFTLQPKN